MIKLEKDFMDKCEHCNKCVPRSIVRETVDMNGEPVYNVRVFCDNHYSCEMEGYKND